MFVSERVDFFGYIVDAYVDAHAHLCKTHTSRKWFHTTPLIYRWHRDNTATHQQKGRHEEVCKLVNMGVKNTAVTVKYLVLQLFYEE